MLGHGADLPQDDQDWSDIHRREEPAERVSLPAWGWLGLAFVVAFWLLGPLAALLDGPALGTWTTIFVSISVQALPFLVLGVVLSGAITVLVPPGWLARALPKRPLVGVPAAGLAGVALPGCECGAVPIAGRLAARGAAPAAAFAFMLAAPAINPVVLVSTAVAFPGRPEVVAARFAASLPPRSRSACCGPGWAATPGSTGPGTAASRARRAGSHSPRPPSTTSCTPAAGWSSAP